MLSLSRKSNLYGRRTDECIAEQALRADAGNQCTFGQPPQRRRSSAALGGVMIRSMLIVTVLILLGQVRTFAAQSADTMADTTVRNPAFARDSGPVVAIDSRHRNYHTIRGRYAPFASLLEQDGLRVVDFGGALSTNSLSMVRLLVVANALPVAEADIKDWNKAQPSALNSMEVKVVADWVRQGGSLLLIADHRPFAGSMASFAHAFGFDFVDVLARRDPQTGEPDIFTVDVGTLKGDEILSGRDESERVTSVQTFAGSAFRIPASAQPVIVLSRSFSLFSCGLPCPEDATKRSADGYYQGAVSRFGRGKVAVFGEAAMFSAQAFQAGDQTYYAGFNAPTAKQNKQFILNLVRWLVSPNAVGAD